MTTTRRHFLSSLALAGAAAAGCGTAGGATARKTATLRYQGSAAR